MNPAGTGLTSAVTRRCIRTVCGPITTAIYTLPSHCIRSGAC